MKKLIILIVFVVLLAGCTQTNNWENEWRAVLNKTNEFFEHLLNLEYTEAKACLVPYGPSYSKLDTWYNKVKSEGATTYAGCSYCWYEAKAFVEVYADYTASIQHEPLRVCCSCPEGNRCNIYPEVSITKAIKQNGKWLLW